MPPQHAKESVYSFRAHVAEINGLDWSYTNEHELATCSQETKVKVASLTCVLSALS